MLNIVNKQRRVYGAFVDFHWRSLCCWLFVETKSERGWGKNELHRRENRNWYGVCRCTVHLQVFHLPTVGDLFWSLTLEDTLF